MYKYSKYHIAELLIKTNINKSICSVYLYIYNNTIGVSSSGLWMSSFSPEPFGLPPSMGSFTFLGYIAQ